MEIEFKRDTAFRKQFFTPESFAHPAKMDAQLLLWIVEKYSQPGETILDPMAGMGTTMLACTLGRHVVLVELEEKFCKMMSGYDCDGRVYGYEDIQLEKEITEGWHLVVESGWASWDDDETFTSKEEALQYGRKNYPDYQETDKTPVNDGESYFSAEYCQYRPAKYERQPKPSTCGRRGKHKPHHIMGNWEIVRTKPQLGFQMGNCQIIQGDARQLEGLLVDKIVSSPPYSDISMGGGLNTKPSREGHNDQSGRNSKSPSQEGAGGYVDQIVTSPPYTNRMDGGMRGSRAGMVPYTNEPPDSWYTQRDQRNIGNLKYGQIEKIITSPPYEGSFTHSEQDPEKRLQRLKEVDEEGVKKGAKWATTSDEALRRRLAQQDGGYGSREENIGNLKQDNYLSAMKQVYLQCHRVLKPGGLLILVVKNFIRNRQVVRLDSNTIKLCEQAGFAFVERHYRVLTSMSFWRRTYHDKFPEVEQIKHEDILVFRK